MFSLKKIKLIPFKRLLLYMVMACGLVILALGLGLFLYSGQFVNFEAHEGTLLVEDAQGHFLAEIGEGQLGFWPVEDRLNEEDLWQPARLGDRERHRTVTCLLAVEDHRFFGHFGVDFKSLTRALWNNLNEENRQGASTIAMQVARMQMRASARTYFQKLLEMTVAIRLVHRFGREKVLKQYIKTAPMGNRIHGIAYAARRYFQKPLVDLSWAEAALLASLPKAPGRMNLFRVQGRVKAVGRAEKVLKSLLQYGVLDKEQLKTSRRLLRTLTLQSKELRPESTTHAILRMQEQEKAKGMISPTRVPLRTSLDLGIQEKTDSLCQAHLDKYRAFGAGNLAALVVEKETGLIKAYVGSAGYGDRSYAGSINYANTPRSSGSTLKPFIFGFGLEDKLFTPSSILADLPWHMTHQSGHYSVFNYDFDYLGPMLYRQALANSRNIPAVQVLQQIGVNETFSRLEAMNLTREKNRGNYYGLGLAIGGLYVTLEDLVTAYGSLANEGEPFALKWSETFALTPNTHRTLHAASARQITLFLSDPLARLPSFPRMKSLEYPFPVAVKTGTSQGFRDAWCVAYSQKYLTGVWMGHPDNQSMKEVGGTIAAALVKEIMLFLHPDETRGKNTEPFPVPKGYEPLSLCPLSGDLASSRCSSVVVEYFPVGEGPRRQTSVHRRVSSQKNSETRTVTILDAAYADWGYLRGFYSGILGGEEGLQDVKSDLFHSAEARITSPVPGSRFFVDPEVPEAFQTISLKVKVQPSVSSVIWYVDGQIYKEVSFPYSVRWPMQTGQHTFQVKFPQANVQSDLASISIE